MTEAASVPAIRAAVEAILPSTLNGPGAAELGVERHVTEQAELVFPGIVTLLEALLDAFASDVRPGVEFAELTVEERQRVLRTMSEDESQDVVDTVDALMLFTIGGVYSEWTGYDRSTGTLAPPASWDEVGYPGPSRGHANYRGER